MYFILTFFLGASIGSFVNVLIDRTMVGRDWIKGRSSCDHCGKPLAWYDMIPLLSFWWYGGKSRCCGKMLTLRHPVIEGLFGALFVWWLVVGFVFFRLATAPLTLVQPIFWLVIGTLLVILAVADLLYGVILMNVVWLGVIWILSYRVILYFFDAYQLTDLVSMLATGLGAYLFLWLLRALTRGQGMGDGDPYLLFLTSLLLSWPRALVGTLSAFIIGAVVGILLIVSGQRKRSQTIPFGPFIVAGSFVGLVWGEWLLRTLYGI